MSTAFAYSIFGIPLPVWQFILLTFPVIFSVRCFFTLLYSSGSSKRNSLQSTIHFQQRKRNCYPPGNRAQNDRSYPANILRKEHSYFACGQRTSHSQAKHQVHNINDLLEECISTVMWGWGYMKWQLNGILSCLENGKCNKTGITWNLR